MGFHPISSGFVSDASDRRATGRYQSNGTTILIEWNDHGASRTVLYGVKLKDHQHERRPWPKLQFSPQAGTSVRFDLGENPAAGTVKAKVVRTSRVRRSMFSLFRRSNEAYRISLKFERACLYEFFKTAIDAFVVENYVNERADPHFDSRDWR